VADKHWEGKEKRGRQTALQDNGGNLGGDGTESKESMKGEYVDLRGYLKRQLSQGRPLGK